MESINESLKSVSKVLEILKGIDSNFDGLPVNCKLAILEAIILLENTIESLSKDA